MNDTSQTEKLLAALIVRQPILSKAAALGSTLFTDPRYWYLIEAAKDTGSAQPEIQAQYLATSEHQVDLSFILDVHQVPALDASPSDVVALERTLRARAAKRLLSSRLECRLDELNRAESDQQIEQAMTRTGRDVVDGSLLLTRGTDPSGTAIRDRARSREHRPYFTCGIPFLDHLTLGMRHGHLWVIAGSYKAGKTRMALNMAVEMLRAELSVTYIALEDTDESFTHRLMGIAYDFDYRFLEAPELFHNDWSRTPAGQEHCRVVRERSMEADEWLQTVGWRCYDYQSGVHDFRTLCNLLFRDKQEHGTDVVILDYMQALGEDYESMTKHAQELLKVTQENQVALLQLNQMSNEAIKGNLGSGQLGTKGSGSVPATCHVGLELAQQRGTDREGKDFIELGVCMKVARHAPQAEVFAAMRPRSGSVLRWYEQPLLLESKLNRSKG